MNNNKSVEEDIERLSQSSKTSDRLKQKHLKGRKNNLDFKISVNGEDVDFSHEVCLKLLHQIFSDKPRFCPAP